MSNLPNDLRSSDKLESYESKGSSTQDSLEKKARDQELDGRNVNYDYIKQSEKTDVLEKKTEDLRKTEIQNNGYPWDGDEDSETISRQEDINNH